MSHVNWQTVCQQLADDLSWLEEHSRQSSNTQGESHQLRLAGSLVRNVIEQVLEGRPARPLHVAVVGGAGSGKSTVANFLMGANAAEANPQAGFTRHPVAYVSGSARWSPPQSPGFLGKLRLLSQPSPSSLDEDVYQIRYIADQGAGVLSDAVVWDCPDMTTWAAVGYTSRFIEVCGLADVLVYVASDERYNDEIPTRFLHLLLSAGKRVIVCLTKMPRGERDSLMQHFAQEVLAKMPNPVLATVAIPQLTPEQLADPVAKAAEYQQALVQEVRARLHPADQLRRTHAENAMNFLRSHQDHLISVAKIDTAALDRWRDLVIQGQADFDDRYQREYLSAERFPRFDEAMIRLIDLMEFPGVGRVISNVLHVVRTPYRLIKGFLQKSWSRPASPPVPERPVMEAALSGWLDYLRAETIRRAGQHPLWSEIAQSFERGMPRQARESFEERFREFQIAVAKDVEDTSRAIYAELEKDPTKLNLIRGGKLALDLGSMTAVLLAGGINVWDFALVPLAASASQMLVDVFGRQYVDSQRETIRRRQGELARQLVSAPLARWLQQHPVADNSRYARLQTILSRVPEQIQQLHHWLTQSKAA